MKSKFKKYDFSESWMWLRVLGPTQILLPKFKFWDCEVPVGCASGCSLVILDFKRLPSLPTHVGVLLHYPLGCPWGVIIGIYSLYYTLPKQSIFSCIRPHLNLLNYHQIKQRQLVQLIHIPNVIDVLWYLGSKSSEWLQNIPLVHTTEPKPLETNVRL